MPNRSGSSVAYSGTTWQELVESSTGRTLYDLDWAFEADHDDTDSEADPGAEDPSHNEREGVDSAVANPNDGQPAVADPAVADPAVADPAVAHPDEAESCVAEQGGSSCDRSSFITRRPRKVTLKPAAKKLYCRRGPKMQVHYMQEGKVPNYLPPDMYTDGATAELRHTQWEAEDANNPCRYCMRDVHMATFVLGAEADPNDLAHRLRDTGVPIIVLVLTEVVAPYHDIFKALNRWATLAAEYNGSRPSEGTDALAVLEFLNDKRIVELGERGDIFVCLHRGRVETPIFEERMLSRREQDADHDLQFGTLTVLFRKGSWDPGDYLRLGIVVSRFRLTEEQTDALAQWIILHRLAGLTGYLPRS